MFPPAEVRLYNKIKMARQVKIDPFDILVHYCHEELWKLQYSLLKISRQYLHRIQGHFYKDIWIIPRGVPLFFLAYFPRVIV